MLRMEINITIILRREYISEKKKYCYVFIRKKEKTNHFDLHFNGTWIFKSITPSQVPSEISMSIVRVLKVRIM